MRKALDNADLRGGLKYCSLMLVELKTSVLSPRNYYILFMAIFDYMRGPVPIRQNSKATSEMTLVADARWSTSMRLYNMPQKSSRGCTYSLLRAAFTFKVMKPEQTKYLTISSP